MRRYCIKENYEHRESVPHFDDTPFTDEFQWHVYQQAHEWTYKIVDNVIDVGCGSGHKLLHFFGSLRTIGIDVPVTVQWLRQKHYDRTWAEAGERPRFSSGQTLVICSDVIEHVERPDEFLDYLRSLHGDYYVLSTPDRDLVDAGISDGPPRNPHHVREWNHDELVEFVSNYFTIERTVRRATTILFMRRK